MAGPPDAEVRALAEGIERFCMLHGSPDLRATTALALESPRLDDEQIKALLFRSEERAGDDFPFPAYTPQLVLDWSWATDAAGDRRVLLPTTLIGRVPRGAPRLVHGTSNGYACHRSADAAARAALLEIVERDAVLLGWYLGRSFPRIELDPDVDVGVRGQVFAWLATQDIDVPVVLMAALLDEDTTRVAAAAGTSFEEALTRASGELRALAGSPASATRAAKETSAVDADSPEGSPLEHQRYFDGPGRQHLVRRAADARKVTCSELHARWPGGNESVAVVVSALQGARLDAWLVKRAIPDLFGTAWHVVRAVVPGCVELSWGTSFRRLASPRILAGLDGGETLNSVPHPLA
jgi:thiazole/oxazole-forming peptide maturase SagD family component